MVKVNRKNKKEELEKTIKDSFEEWKEVLEGLKNTAEKAQMPLLAKSIDMDIEILKVYEKAFLHVVD